MAKVTGPLMSLDASGTVAGTVTFSKWKGRNYVRQRVIPSNPRSEDQENARNAMRVAGTAQRWVSLSVLTGPSRSVTDLEAIQANTPGDQAWNGYLSGVLIGPGASAIMAATSAWNSLEPAEQAAWDTAAAGLTPAFPSTHQTMAEGAPDDPLSGGHGFFIYQYALAAILGLDAPDETPPFYS